MMSVKVNQLSLEEPAKKCLFYEFSELPAIPFVLLAIMFNLAANRLV